MTSEHDCVLIDCPDSTRCIVFGLRWFALVGSDIEGKARRRARQGRATHYVIGQAQGAVVGFGKLSLKNNRQTLHAAAQLFARENSEENVACLAIFPDGRAWIVASLLGAVLAQTDKIYTSAEAARSDWLALLTQYPTLRECDGHIALDRIMESGDEQAAMAKLASRWKILPLPLRVGVVALSLTLVLPPVMQRIRQYVRPAQPQMPVVDAALAWRQAWQELLRATPVHESSQLQQAFASLHDLPLQLQGWVLRAARCAPESWEWRCTAHYWRVHPMATNESFVQTLPRNWKLEFQPLDGVRASWSVPLAAASLAVINPPPSADVNTRLISDLQRALPVFAGIVLGEPLHLDAVAPVGPNGELIAQIEPMPGVLRRDLVLTGPLRSFALLGELAMVAAWTELSLRVIPERQPTKSQSVLDVQLKGVIYEQAS